MEQETAGADAEKKDKNKILHTEGQRKRAKAHKDRLKKEGQNATLVLCSDISSIESLNIDDVDSLHLIVDTYMYGILMDIDRLCDAAYNKFKELDRARRTVYVLNHFQNEFDKLYRLIPENVRENWDKNEQERLHKGDGISHRQPKDHLTTFEECEFDVKGVSGGSMKTSNTCGNVGGGMGNTNSGDVANNPGMTGMSKDCTIENQTNFYFETKGEYKISCIRIREQNSSTARVEQGLQPSPESHLLVTIKSEGNDQAISDTVEKNQDKLKSKEVRDVQIMNGSVIIKLIVEKNYIMTDAWVQSILMMLFYDILGDFFTEETTFEVSVERKVCLGEEELIKLYTSQENHSNCVSKVEFEAMKSKLKEMALQGQDCSSLNGSPKIKTETHDENKFDQEPVGENRIDDESFRENPLLAEQLLETRQASDDGNRRKEEEEELDVLTEAPVVAVRKETRQLHRVHQNLNVNVKQQQFGDVSVEADTIGNMTLGGQQHIHQTHPAQQHIHQTHPAQQQKEKTQQDGTSASNKTQERRRVDALSKKSRTMAALLKGDDDRTILSTAVLGKKTPAVLALVKHGADVNIDEGVGVTPLMHLYKQDKVDIESMMYMITTGSADINQPDEIGVTPLHWLSRNSSVSVDDIKQLIVKGRGDINRPDDFGFTPLHYLCTRNLDIKSLVSLIQATGGKVNQADKIGNTSLHYLSVTNTQSADYLLKNIPGADGHAANVVGISAIDYLRGNAKPSHLYVTAPLTQTSEDLVIKLNGGDSESISVQEVGRVARSLISVLCRAMILNSERVHRDLQVEGRELNNMEKSGYRETPYQFKRFRGTCSSALPLPPSPSPISSPSYWETQCQLGWRERGLLPLLEMGVKEGRRDIDGWRWVSRLPGSVCVSVVDDCHLHTDHLCIQVMRKDQRWEYKVGECVTLPLPTSGELTFTFGLVLDVGRGRVGIVDVERGKLLCKIDKVFTQEVFPMFYVPPFNHVCDARMRLVSGREISVTDSKIKLIQQALSD